MDLALRLNVLAMCAAFAFVGLSTNDRRARVGGDGDAAPKFALPYLFCGGELFVEGPGAF